MPSKTLMSLDSCYEYLRQMQVLYRQATRRKEKSRLLDAMEAATGYHRKYRHRFNLYRCSLYNF